eukprot:sb/3473333/
MTLNSWAIIAVDHVILIVIMIFGSNSSGDQFTSSVCAKLVIYLRFPRSIILIRYVRSKEKRNLVLKTFWNSLAIPPAVFITNGEKATICSICPCESRIYIVRVPDCTWGHLFYTACAIYKLSGFCVPLAGTAIVAMNSFLLGFTGQGNSALC